MDRKKDTPDYKGEPGPQEGRRCRDVFFLILFILFCIAFIVVGGMSVKYGDLNRIRYGTDSQGNLCGTNNTQTLNNSSSVNSSVSVDATSLPYLFFFTPGTSGGYSRCVSQCPTSNTTTITASSVICKYGVTPSNILLPAQILSGDCVPQYSSESVLYRCFPTSLSSYNFSVPGIEEELNNLGSISQLYQSVQNNYKDILIGAAISLGLSIIWLFLVQIFAGLVVWMTVLLSLLSTLGITAFLGYNYYLSMTGGALFSSHSTHLDSALQNHKTLLGLTIAFGIITVILWLVVCVARKRISLAVGVAKVASKASRHVMSAIFLPIGSFVIKLGLFSATIIVLMLLETSGASISETIIQDQAKYTKVTFQVNNTIRGLQIFYLFGLFWLANFVNAVECTTIAGSIASWYWCRDKKAIKPHSLLRSLWRCFRYHLGSLAFGSLLIAFMQLIRWLLYMFRKKFSGQSKFLAMMLACVQCCLLCIQKILELINKNAYIEIAVYGYSFCDAAKTAFGLLVRNSFRLLVIDGVSWFLIFLNKLLNVSVTCIVVLYLLEKDSSSVEYLSGPLIIVAFLSFSIVTSFCDIFSMSIDTIFLCFCEDSERNNGTPEAPYYAEESLLKFIEKHPTDQPKL